MSPSINTLRPTHARAGGRSAASAADRTSAFAGGRSSDSARRVLPFLPRSACSTVADHPSETITIRPGAVRNFCSSLKPPAARAARGRPGRACGLAAGPSRPAARPNCGDGKTSDWTDASVFNQARLSLVWLTSSEAWWSNDDATHIESRSWADAGDDAHADLTMKTGPILTQVPQDGPAIDRSLRPCSVAAGSSGAGSQGAGRGGVGARCLA